MVIKAFRDFQGNMAACNGWKMHVFAGGARAKAANLTSATNLLQNKSPATGRGQALAWEFQFLIVHRTRANSRRRRHLHVRTVRGTPLFGTGAGAG
jgi:hypothetical protein